MLSALGSLGRTKRQTGEQSSWQALTGGLWNWGGGGEGEEGGLSVVYRKREPCVYAPAPCSPSANSPLIIPNAYLTHPLL